MTKIQKELHNLGLFAIFAIIQKDIKESNILRCKNILRECHGMYKYKGNSKDKLSRNVSIRKGYIKKFHSKMFCPRVPKCKNCTK